MPRTVDQAVTEAVRERLRQAGVYGAAQDFLERAWNQVNYRPPTPDRPTTLPPGEARVEVYAMRLRRGFDLWHPDDPPPPT